MVTIKKRYKHSFVAISMHDMHTRIGFDKLEQRVQCVSEVFDMWNHPNRYKYNDKDLCCTHKQIHS